MEVRENYHNFAELTVEELEAVSGGGIVRDISAGAIKGGIAGGVGAAASGADIGSGIAAGAAAGAATAAMDRGSSGGSGGGRSRVICTHFFKKGMLSKELWRADLDYTFEHLSPQTIRGYQFWAIPYVKLMRKSVVAEKVMYPIAKYRALEIAYKLGLSEKGSYRGKLIRLIFEPLCFAIGFLVKEQDWESLWKSA